MSLSKTPPSGGWLSRYHLKLSDREIILGGKWLTSDIINAAMTVLQQQFPSFSGFQCVMRVPIFSDGAWYIMVYV